MASARCILKAWKNTQSGLTQIVTQIVGPDARHEKKSHKRPSKKIAIHCVNIFSAEISKGPTWQKDFSNKIEKSKIINQKCKTVQWKSTCSSLRYQLFQPSGLNMQLWNSLQKSNSPNGNSMKKLIKKNDSKIHPKVGHKNH